MGGGPSVVHRLASRSQKSNTELIHSFQANFASAIQAVEEEEQNNGTNGNVNGANATPHPHKTYPYTSWTAKQDSTLFIPALDFTDSGLAEERSQYEITVKLFFLANKSPSRRCAQTRDAVGFVLQELHVPSIDLLIVSYPGIAFDAEEEAVDSVEEANATAGSEENLQADARAEDTSTMLQSWACLEDLHKEGIIARLGVAEFGTERLSKFLRTASVRPCVDQINVRDCCVVPKPLIMYAKEENVELLTHNDCTNILPSGTLRELLGPTNGGFGVLADTNGQGEGLKGDVEPQWVIKYTAVVRNRGVIENKGYFAAAEVKDGS